MTTTPPAGDPTLTALARRAGGAIGATALLLGLSAAPVAAASVDDDATELLRLLNGERAAHGLAAVQPEATLGASARSHATIAWPHRDDECASSAIVTDVVRPGGAAGRSHVVAIVLGTSWGSFTESARYFASFIRVPGLR